MGGILQLQAPESPPSPPEPDMVYYQPTPARHIIELISTCAFSESDVLVDLGSGLGHVPLLVSILTGIETIGIELNPSYLASARSCAQSLRLHRTTFVHSDARTADLTRGTVFYLYTPFTGAMLQAVVARLREEAFRRPIRIATLGPCTPELARASWLTPQSHPDPDRLTLFASRS